MLGDITSSDCLCSMLMYKLGYVYIIFNWTFAIWPEVFPNYKETWAFSKAV